MLEKSLIPAELDGLSAPDAPDAPAAAIRERRLQMLAYEAWSEAAAREARRWPHPAAMDACTIEAAPDFRDHSFLLALDPEHDDPVFRFIGDALREDVADCGPIERQSDVPHQSLLSRLSDHYLQCVAQAAPVGFEASFEDRRGRTLFYRGIILPLSDDGERIDHVWGAIRAKVLPGDPPADKDTPKASAKAPKPAASRSAPPAKATAPTPRAPEPQPAPPAKSPAACEQKDPSMSLEQKITECMNIEGAVAAALVDCDSGMAIATAGDSRKVDLNLAAAAGSNVLRAQQSALSDLGIEESVEDVLVTMDSQYQMLRPLSDASGKGLAVFLMLNKSKANLAMARFKLSKIEKELVV